MPNLQQKIAYVYEPLKNQMINLIQTCCLGRSSKKQWPNLIIEDKIWKMFWYTEPTTIIIQFPQNAKKQPLQRFPLFWARINRGRGSFTLTGQLTGVPERGTNILANTNTQHSRAPATSRIQPCSPACSNLFSCQNSQPAQSRKIEIFSKQLEKTNQRPIFIGKSAGIHHPFHFSSKKANPPKSIVMSKDRHFRPKLVNWNESVYCTSSYKQTILAHTFLLVTFK